MVVATHIKDGGVIREASELHIKDGGIWREVSELYVKDGGIWRLAHQGVVPITSVTLPTPVNTTVEAIDSGGATNNYLLTPTITDGDTPFTYLWELVSGSGLSNSSVTGATLTLSLTASPGDGLNINATETWKVTVTNAKGGVTSNNSVVTLNVFGNFF